MKTASRERSLTQRGLFEPPKKRPTWRELPRETRRETIRLLAGMLKDRVRRDAREGSVRDE